MKDIFVPNLPKNRKCAYQFDNPPFQAFKSPYTYPAPFYADFYVLNYQLLELQQENSVLKQRLKALLQERDNRQFDRHNKEVYTERDEELTSPEDPESIDLLGSTVDFRQVSRFNGQPPIQRWLLEVNGFSAHDISGDDWSSDK